MSADITKYVELITSEHNQKPNLLATVSLLVHGLADTAAVLATIPGLYDLDVAVGGQEDTVGQWVGRTRFLTEPLTGVYFSFDTAGLGFDQGVWLGPFDPTTGLVALFDEAYRVLLKATIAANQWDGTIPGAYAAWDVLFAGDDFTLLIFDHGDMTMTVGFIGASPDLVTLGLLETGQLLKLKPAGVRIDYYVIPSVPDVPLFGFDLENSSISGFDVGAWGTLIPAS